MHTSTPVVPNRIPSEAGSTLVVAMLGTVALLAVAGIAAVTIRTGTILVRHDGEIRVAHYAAEAGIASAVEYLKTACSVSGGFSQVIAGDSVDDLPLTWGNEIGRDDCSGGPGSCVETSCEPWCSEDGNFGTETGDPLGTSDDELDNDAFFDVSFQNNAADTSGSPTIDGDDTVIIRSAGHAGSSEVLLLAQFHATNCTNINFGGYPGEFSFGDADGPDGDQSTLSGEIDTASFDESGFF